MFSTETYNMDKTPPKLIGQILAYVEKELTFNKPFAMDELPGATPVSKFNTLRKYQDDLFINHNVNLVFFDDKLPVLNSWYNGRYNRFTPLKSVKRIPEHDISHKII